MPMDGMTECVKRKKEKDDEFWRVSEDRIRIGDIYRSTRSILSPPHHASCRVHLPLYFLFFTLSSLGSTLYQTLHPPHPPRVGDRIPLSAGKCSDTSPGEHYGPDAQKEGESVRRRQPPLCLRARRGCDDNRSALPAPCQLLGLVPRRLD